MKLRVRGPCRSVTVVGAVALLGLGSSPASAATLLVPDPYPTIQEALDNAADGDTVEVAPGLYAGLGNVDLTFDTSVELRSAGGPTATILDAGSDLVDRHLHASFGPGSLSPIVDGFTLRGGTGGTLELGGSVFSAGGSATFRNCVFEENSVRASGGAVFASGATLAFQNCDFLSNEAENEAGAVRLEQGTVASFVDCRFAGNMADVGRGGAIVSRQSSLVLSRCLLFGNLASSKGGGALLVDGGSAEVIRSTLAGNRAGNTASDFGGALLAEGSSEVTLVRSVIYGNEAFSSYDEAAVMSGSSATFECCVVGLPEVGGTGSIEFTNVTEADPLFCEDRLPSEAPTTEGMYTVADDSPCLPANSPCGLAIGPFDTGSCSVANVPSSNGFGSIGVFPNPTSGQFSLSTRRPVLDLVIVDVGGRRIETTVSFRGEAPTVELPSGLGPGAYYVRVRTDAGWDSAALRLIR